MQHNDEFLALVNATRPFIKEVDVNFVAKQLDSNADMLLIDVREDSEWATGHIANAIHLSRGIIERDIEKTVSNKDTPIVVYCAGGFRSVLAAANLQKMGYTNVASMATGIRGWVNAGHQITV